MQAQCVHLLAVGQGVDLAFHLGDGSVDVIAFEVFVPIGRVGATPSQVCESRCRDLFVETCPSDTGSAAWCGVAPIRIGRVICKDARQVAEHVIELADLLVLGLHSGNLVTQLRFHQLGALALYGEQCGFDVHARRIDGVQA